MTLSYEKIQSLRYGENPHQSAAFYIPAEQVFLKQKKKDTGWEQIQGKELSFNNILDANAALITIMNLPRPGSVIVKHLNPCGAAVVRDPREDVLEEELHNTF